VEHRRTDPDHLLEPSWILPQAPPGYGGPGTINPYSNVNPLNPMAAEMQARAAGQAMQAAPPPTGTSSARAPGPFSHYED